MYKQIFNNLSEAKSSGNKDIINSSLLFLITEIENILNMSPSEHKSKLPFSEFVEDSQLLFEVKNQTVFNQNEADLNVSSEGLIAELLQMYDIPKSNIISNKIRDHILSIHSKYSRGICDNSLEVNEFRSVLKDIKDKIS